MQWGGAHSRAPLPPTQPRGGTHLLGFKHKPDLDRWREGGGSATVRDRITAFNSLSELTTGKSVVVTSWGREDATFHNPATATDREAVDFRVRHYGPLQRRRLYRAAVRAGIPIVLIGGGTPNAHWHCGDLATLVYERRD